MAASRTHSLRGAVTIVTGASSGIGEATARLASAQGAKLMLAARRGARLEQLAAELGGEVEIVPADLRDLEQVRHVVARAVARFDRVDVLVNNAGQGLHTPLENVTDDDFRAVVELNLFAPLAAMRAVIPVMRAQGGGTIVNVSSGTVRMPLPGVGAYAATKAALDKLTETARIELAADGIRLVSVWPFITATEFHETLRAGHFSLPPGMEPHTAEYVAEQLLTAVEHGPDELVLAPH